MAARRRATPSIEHRMTCFAYLICRALLAGLNITDSSQLQQVARSLTSLFKCVSVNRADRGASASLARRAPLVSTFLRP